MPQLPLPKIDVNSPTWLRQLRWLAIVGMGSAVLGAYLVQAQINFTVLFGLLAALTIWNYFLPYFQNNLTSTNSYLYAQVLPDLAVLTLMLWFSGGLVNPFSTFYILHVLIAGLLLSSRQTQLITALSIASILGLMFAPPLHFPNGSLALFNLAAWPGIPLALIILILCSSGFIFVYLARMKNLQLENAHREKMAALGRLCGGMAHELGTPLNSILLLAKNLESQVADSNIKPLQTIQQQTRRCGDLVALLMGYTKPGSAGNALNARQINVHDFVRDILQQMNSTLVKRTKIDVHTSHNDIELPELAVRQVLSNVVKNSLQALQHSPSPRVQITFLYENETLIIRVQDNGPGFNEEQRSKAFEAFFSTKEPDEGSGLGLYISYFLLEQVGGKIAIIENKSKGALIQVTVPAQLTLNPANLGREVTYA